jgi:UDP-2,3-diacylglucosamine pyrophosphatase LpxH
VRQKVKFIISDLHLGAGLTHPGGNCLEDFLADQQLVNFLDAIRRESIEHHREVELIINGDFFEFLQVPAIESYDPATPYPIEAYLDSSPEASVQRLNLITQGHPDVFAALSDFMHVERPQRRITIIKGNHDVNLFWPVVKSRLRETLGASGARASLLLFADEFVSREKIYIEHGHQRAETINAYPDFFNPRSAENPAQLYYPVGSRFVINVFSDLERERWFIDHVKPITTLIWYALQWDFDFAARVLAGFIRQTSPQTNRSILDEVLPSPTDLLLQDLDNPDRRGELARQYTSNPAWRQQFHQQIQPYLTLTHNSADPLNSDNPLALGQSDQAHQDSLLLQAATEVAEREGAVIVLFGHTHRTSQTTLNNGSVYINTGAWVADLTNTSTETWQALFSGALEARDTTLGFPYARIDYDENDLPAAQLLYFGQKPKTVANGILASIKNWLARVLK